MTVLVVIALMGWAVYKFFKLNTSAGTEAVRAYYFLEACLAGNDQLNANRFAHLSLTGGSPIDIQRVLSEINSVHGGKQLPLIAEAYRMGMHPMMPRWYQSITMNAPVTPAIELIYRAPLARR
ncbi:hypothetical protein [Shinella zoogloeoides]|uniref:hypothetical protein n=1 Tax=Shinella zoogloeoides TaxID=352475 RepID=UPI001F57B63C|nr:hypothetical protein [Shinella zoogloeoides]